MRHRDRRHRWARTAKGCRWHHPARPDLQGRTECCRWHHPYRPGPQGHPGSRRWHHPVRHFRPTHMGCHRRSHTGAEAAGLPWRRERRRPPRPPHRRILRESSSKVSPSCRWATTVTGRLNLSCLGKKLAEPGRSHLHQQRQRCPRPARNHCPATLALDGVDHGTHAGLVVHHVHC